MRCFSCLFRCRDLRPRNALRTSSRNPLRHPLLRYTLLSHPLGHALRHPLRGLVMRGSLLGHSGSLRAPSLTLGHALDWMVPLPLGHLLLRVSRVLGNPLMCYLLVRCACVWHLVRCWISHVHLPCWWCHILLRASQTWGST